MHVKDDLLSDQSNKEIDNDDDGGEKLIVQLPLTMSIDDIVLVEDNDDSEGNKGSQCDNDSDANNLLDDDTREVQMVVNSSNDAINISSVQFRNQLEKYEHKLDVERIHKLRVGDVFRNMSHFKQVLHEVIVRKKIKINIKYYEPRRYYVTCKELGHPWFVNGARLNNRNGF